MRAELQSLTDQAADQTATLRLAETLSAFLTRLRSAAQTLDIIERQRIVRLLVKEVLVAEGNIVIRHSIPVVQTSPSSPDDPPPPEGRSPSGDKSYLLRPGRRQSSPRQSLSALHVRCLDDSDVSGRTLVPLCR